MQTVPLLEDLDARGLVHDSTDRAALAARLTRSPLTLYYGCDPTADSLHVGNLVGLVVLRRFLDAGHHPLALAGGATGMIGDPSGKSEERVLLDPDTLQANLAAIKEQISRILGNSGWTMVDNQTWTAPMGLLEFLRNIGKHFTVNQMVHKESVRARMDSEEGISFTEFSYMLLQANDYLVLHAERDCELQIGGSDQWGNITAGIDLIRRKTGATVHGLTWPLITRSDGRKFGKTEEGTVWLAAHRTSTYRFYQYWMNVPDADVGGFLRMFTLIPLEEIASIEARVEAAPELREAQRRLADEVTGLVHGPQAATAASEASRVLFGASPAGASSEALTQLAGEIPTTRVERSALIERTGLEDLLLLSGAAGSRSDARRHISQGAAYVNNVRVGDGYTVGEADLLHGRYLLLRRGKKEYRLIEAL